MIKINIESNRINAEECYLERESTLIFDNDSSLEEIKLDLENEAGLDFTTEEFLSLCKEETLTKRDYDRANSFKEIFINLYQEDCASF